MKKLGKILLAICALIIIAGIVLTIKNGFKFAEGYSMNLLLNTAKQYAIYFATTVVLVLAYLGIRYSKRGIAKTIAQSLLTIIFTLVLIFAIFMISTLPISKIIFTFLIFGYVSCILILTAYYEQTK